MSIAARLLLAIALLLCLTRIESAAAELRAIPAIGLVPGRDVDDVHQYVRYARNIASLDQSGVDALLAAKLLPLGGTAVHFGSPGVRTTVVLHVKNAGVDQGSWIFTTGRGSLSEFRLYEVDQGKARLLVDNQDAPAAKMNLRAFQAFSSELVLNPGQEKFLIVEFLSENSTYMPLQIRTYGTFFSDRRANVAMVAGIAMAMLVLTFLNALFYSITGQKEFGWLAAAQICMMLSTVHGEGYFNILLLSDKPLTALALEDVLKCGFAAAMLQFGRSFLDTRRTFARRDVVMRALIAGALLLMAAQAGLYFFSPAARAWLHGAVWIYTALVALFMPVLGYAAVRRLGAHHWPLLLGWASLAIFIIYAGIASMGLFSWLPINWHVAGPVGLFESLMVTIALGLNIRQMQRAKVLADDAHAKSILDQLKISERAARLAEEKAFALQAVTNQSALLHASGHDSKHVILALNNAIAALKSSDRPPAKANLIEMLESSADYLNQIISTTMSGAIFPGIEDDFVALSCFEPTRLLGPLQKMFEAGFESKGLTLKVSIAAEISLFTDRPMLMRALANLLSNAHKFTARGGATLSIEAQGDQAVFDIRDTGIGMSAELVASLMNGTEPRLRANVDVQGSGSGFNAAKRLIERLGGSTEIVASSHAGTHIRIRIPMSFEQLSPCTQGDLQQLLPNWNLVDFDRQSTRGASAAKSIDPNVRTIGLTYDDTSETRAAMNAMVAITVIKPLYYEMADHPLLRIALDQP